MEQILGFRENYSWLSNFHECQVIVDNLTFSSSEAAFQAQKCAYLSVKQEFTKLTAVESKKLGKRVVMRRDWESNKLKVMEQVLTAKFTQNPHLLQLLKDTGDAYLEETNYWRDTYLGVCNGIGTNHLGKLLMRLRNSL